jgi:hypothetical protein
MSKKQITLNMFKYVKTIDIGYNAYGGRGKTLCAGALLPPSVATVEGVWERRAVGDTESPTPDDKEVKLVTHTTPTPSTTTSPNTGTRGVREFLTRTQSAALRTTAPHMKVSIFTHMHPLPVPPVSMNVKFIDGQEKEFLTNECYDVICEDIVEAIGQVSQQIQFAMEARGETVE